VRGKKSVTLSNPMQSRIPDEAIETSKLLVEFLHAAYATRHQRLDDRDNAESGAGDVASTSEEASRPKMSAHAGRAAIHVYQHGERTVGQLAAGLGVSYGWASRVVDELATAHYVIRERDAVDRRIVHVRLDRTAVDEVERAYAWRGEAVRHALEPLSDSERAAVRLFLRRIVDLMRERELERPQAVDRPPTGPESVQSPP